MGNEMNKIQKLEDAQEKFKDSLRKKGLNPESPEMMKVIEKLNEVTGYTPRVGVLGKTGVGKSSLCNALFGKDVALISDIEACTREPQEVFLSLKEDESGGIILIDVPGVGESRERDLEYKELYKKLLPKFDLVLWVLKADDRAYSVDEEVYKSIVNPMNIISPILFVLNQSDKIEPHREWNSTESKPSSKQLENIRKKAKIVSNSFGVRFDDVVAVSASEGFGLEGLVNQIVTVLPNEKKFSFVRESKEEHVSKEAVDEAEKGVWSAIRIFFQEKADDIGRFISDNKEEIYEAGKMVIKYILSVAKKTIN